MWRLVQRPSSRPRRPRLAPRAAARLRRSDARRSRCRSGMPSVSSPCGRRGCATTPAPRGRDRPCAGAASSWRARSDGRMLDRLAISTSLTSCAVEAASRRRIRGSSGHVLDAADLGDSRWDRDTPAGSAWSVPGTRGRSRPPRATPAARVGLRSKEVRLARRERPQLGDVDPAGQRLGDPGHRQEPRRARQQNASRRALAVNERFDVRSKVSPARWHSSTTMGRVAPEGSPDLPGTPGAGPRRRG